MGNKYYLNINIFILPLQLKNKIPVNTRIFLTKASKKLKIRRFVESLLEGLKRAEDYKNACKKGILKIGFYKFSFIMIQAN